jgi:hypothetical protein
MKFSNLLFLCLGLAASTALLRSDTPSLVNLSTRAQVGTGGNIIISGFVVGAGGNKTVLIRGIGPALTGYGARRPQRPGAQAL